MKAVLISIQPKWCDFIAQLIKKIEVRKTRPKINVPFKCYIYCSEKDYDKIFCVDKFMHKAFLNGNGKQKVIGEFICDRIDEIGYSPEMHGQYVSNIENLHEVSCVNFDEMFDYIADGFGYGWHISNLVIYDKPRELSEFQPICKYNMDSECVYWDDCKHKAITTDWGYPANMCYKKITRPPQSWCYVEELGV